MNHLYKLAIPVVLLLACAPGAKAQPAVGKSTAIEATGLYEIVYNPTANEVYVAAAGPRGKGEGKIQKLDPQTLAVRGTIAVGADVAYGLGLNNKTQTLYTTNTVAGSISAIDLKTGKITLIKKEGEKPHFREVIVDEESNTVYASVAGAQSSIWVMDGAKHEVSRVISDTGNVTTGIALDKAGNRLFLTNMSENKVAVLDLATDKITARYEAGGEGPTNLAYDARAGRLFVANQKTGDLTVLEAGTGKLLKAVKTGAGALGVSFNPEKNRVYVANRGAGTVTVVDGATYEVLANLETGTHPNTVAVDARSGAAFITNKAKRSPNGETDPKGDTVSLITP